MKKYSKESTRIPIQFINSETEEVLFEINDRNWMNIGEVFTDNVANSIMATRYRGREHEMPDNFMIIIAKEFIS